MKSKRHYFILIMLMGLTLTACLKDKEPTVSLLNGRFMTTNVEISPGGVLMFKWIAEKGKSDLSSFTIRVNGDDLYGFPTTSIAPDVYLDSAFMEGPTDKGNYTFSFTATDMDGKFGTKAIVVTVP